MDKLMNNFKSEKIINLLNTNSIIYDNTIELYNIIGECIFNINEERLINIINNQERLNIAKHLIFLTNKINILENPLITDEFIEYLYPNIKKDYIVKLLEFDTLATKNIIELIKSGNIENINKILNFFEVNFELEKDNRLIHMIFINYEKCQNLYKELINNKITTKALNTIKANLLETILNNNLYNINSIVDLIPNRYKEKENNFLNELSQLTDSNEMQKELCSFLISKLEKFTNGNPIIEMKYYMKFYRLDEICEDIRNVAIENIKHSQLYINNSEHYDKKLKECMFNNDERMFIVIIQNIMNYNDSEVLKLLIEEMKNISNISIKFKNIIEKTRRLFNLEMNSKLSSDLDYIEGKRNTLENGVEIIEPTGEFNFLCHTLYGYDKEHRNYVDMIIEDPSKWDKLDGASTISTSSISNKSISILGKDEHGRKSIIYLFNKTPDNFLLYMNDRDLDLEHGNNKFNPIFSSASFTTLNGLNYETSKSGYNEVAGWRKDMNPCAIAIFEDTPNDNQIKAAQYFNVPIIKLNKHIKIENFGSFDEFEKYKDTLNTEDLVDYIFSNISEYEGDINTTYYYRIKNVINYLLNSLKYSIQLNNVDKLNFVERIKLEQNNDNYKILTTQQVLIKINELEKLICQIYNDDTKDIYMKIISIRYSLSNSLNLTDEEILTIENIKSINAPISFESYKSTNNGISFKRNNELYTVTTDVENYEFKTTTKEI